MSNTKRRIVLTGASRGLGRALLAGFAEEGHAVLGCAHSAAGVEKLRAAYPSPHRFDAVDVANEAQVQRWAEEVIAQGGPPDLLINNAAIVNDKAPLWQVPGDQFSRVIDINIKGVFHVLHHFIPAMVAAQSGVIVNLSSGWGRSTSPEVAPYCATKYAVEGLTLALAQELPKGMAAVPLNPGIIDTDMLRQCFGKEAGQYPSPEKWAEQAVPYLLQLGPRDNGKSLTVPA
jgi:NAD(P)-dependent dehydrogenase (short-subunit alcohol dehydrogenase family)